jgi:hypothetical protein
MLRTNPPVARHNTHHQAIEANIWQNADQWFLPLVFTSYQNLRTIYVLFASAETGRVIDLKQELQAPNTRCHLTSIETPDQVQCWAHDSCSEPISTVRQFIDGYRDCLFDSGPRTWQDEIGRHEVENDQVPKYCGNT